LILGT
jgi:hypothetical protein